VSDRGLRITIAALALAGTGISAYLTYVHYAGVQVVCVAGGGGCETVQSSSYAELAGIPVAVLGLIGYVAILASVLVTAEAGRLGGAGLALAGFGFSLYLTYRELFTIKAVCQWCVASAVVMALLVVATVWRLLLVGEDGATDEPAPARAGL
jgi:uncharacterized membrane protein